METLYAKNSFLDEFKLMNKQQAAGKYSWCTELDLTCHQELDEYGIWLNIGETHLLVSPLDLMESLFNLSGNIYIDTVIENGERQNMNFKIEYVQEKYITSWSLSHPCLKKQSRNYYWKEDHIKKVCSVIEQLYVVWKNGNSVAYKDNITSIQALEICAKQCKVPYAFPRDFRLTTKEITVEDFVFDVLQAEEYRIGLGNRSYEAYLYEWENNFEKIRYQLEGISFYGNDTSISLYSDMAEMVVSLKKESILDKIVKFEHGEGYQYKDYLYVSMSYNECEHMPPMAGYCDVKKTVLKLYESLLQMALLYPETANDDIGKSRITAYNQLKSPMIESFLLDKKENNDTYITRQVHIRSVLLINPENEGLITDDNNNVIGKEKIEQIVEGQFDAKGFYRWGRKTNIENWEDYHQKGLEYAKQLRKCLPCEYDLWYQKQLIMG